LPSLASNVQYQSILAMLFNEIKCHVNTSLGLVGGMHPVHASPLCPRLSIVRLRWCKVLQLTASPWTTEASTRERWQFGALTNRKATSSSRASSTSSLYYYQVALSLYGDEW